MGIRAAEAHDVLASIVSARSVAIGEVLILRRQVWPDGAVTRDEAARLLEVNRAVEDYCPEWADFIVETLTDHLTAHAHPKGFVSDIDAKWIEAQLLQGGPVRGAVELEALVSILERAIHAPHRLQKLALDTVVEAILSGDRDLLGNQALEKGVVSDPEVALLRRIIYARAAASGEPITAYEANAITRLNRETAAETICTTWTTLYVTVLSNFLLTQRDYLSPSREHLREIDRWLNRPSAGREGFEAAVSDDLNMPQRSEITGDIRAAFGPLSPMKELYEPVEVLPGAALSTQTHPDEAAWLVDDLCRETTLTANERALLTFLSAGAYTIHPGLRSLVALAG